jgi:RHS repeat-associated protein
MSTTQTSSNLNINVPGYYIRTYQATDYFEYAVNFTIVFKVGNPSTVRVPQSHVRHVYQSIWQDQLERTETVHYNPDGTISSTTIKSLYEYDLQGNPTKISSFKYENSVFDYADLFWEGRQLVHLIAYSFTEEEIKVRHVWYTYNDQGIRVSKRIDLTGDGVADQDIRYVLLGNLVQSEIMHNTVDNQSIETYQINYLHDVDGSPVGFEFHEFGLDPELYLYVRNLQGDVVKILDSSGNVVVEYEYDAYGIVLFILEPEGSTIGQINSIRYRSYRFDSEINMYYLNSRYYVPELGRFLNADGLLGPVGNILGHNMYAYCANNPVMYLDPSGFAWEHWGVAAIVIVILVVATIITAGGAFAAFNAILMASAGIASISPSLTVLSFALYGFASVLGGMTIYAALSSTSLDEFAAHGEEALISSGAAGIYGAFAGYLSWQQQLKQSSSSWASIRTKYWKSESSNPNSPYFQNERASRGLSPIGISLHHPYGRHGSKIDMFYPMPTSEHIGLHREYGSGWGSGGYNRYYPFDFAWRFFRNLSGV